MDRATMRKRGWSIQSDQTSCQSNDTDNGGGGGAVAVPVRLGADAVVASGDTHCDETTKATRTCEGELDEDEKRALLHAFPIQAVHADDGDEEAQHRQLQSPAKKKQKTVRHENDKDGTDEPTMTSITVAKEEQLNVAKTKLSKWAARLFDPDRPRGLVQAPQTIPLNDEFLTAFGKREREFDDKMGRKMEIDQQIVDRDDDDDDDDASSEVMANNGGTSSLDATKKLPVDGRKVKIVNLAYTTTEATLEAACQSFGPVENTNLLMDKERPTLNAGRAYVTFESSQSADACVDGLQSLDGRQLRVSIAPTETKRSAGSRRGVMGAGSASRYWVKDISTKCFRCGQVGHMEADCPNAAILKPCPLCGGTDHDMRSCPKSRVCFRCGVPGHINRECSFRQNLPKRIVCGICFQSGHHRASCRRRAADAPSYDAKCFVCHERGHFMCKEMKWFFGLEGVSCFNCGRTDHQGYDCDRPGVDLCSRDDGMADREIDRAEAMSLADELEQQRARSSRNRGRGREYRDEERGRAKSQPPRQSRSSDSGGSRRPSHEGNGSRHHDDGGSRRDRARREDEQRHRSNGSNQGNRGYDTSRRDDKKRRRR